MAARRQRSGAASPAPSARKRGRAASAEQILDSPDVSLLDIVDNVLNNGVVLSGDLTIALAHVDLIYARLSLLLCAADRILPGESKDFLERHDTRRVARAKARR